VVREPSSRRWWRSAGGVVAFAGAVALLTIGVIGWQHARAANARAARQARRFPGAETVLWRGSELPPATLDAPVRAAILRDPASDGYYESRATMDSVVAAWRAELTDIGATVRVVSPT
jgi:hypothetical protein